MQRVNQLKNRLVFLFLILSAMTVFQCDSFFTYSPFAGLLARDPVYLSRTEKFNYAEAALAGRKTDAMIKALAALELDGQASLTSAECLVMGQIAMVLSGVDQQLAVIMASFAILPDYIAMNTIINALLPQKDYIAKAANYYWLCDVRRGATYPMAGTDYFLGCMLILFDGAIEANVTPPVNIDDIPMAASLLTNANTLAGVGIARLQSVDPTHMAVYMLQAVQGLVLLLQAA